MNDWRADAACRGLDPDLFYAEGRGGMESYDARRICAGCPVAAQCLDEALATNELFGVGGGHTARQRMLLRRTRHLTRHGHYSVGPRTIGASA